MPLANILLISALALPGTQAGYAWASFQESQAQTAHKPDSPQETPKSVPAEPGKAEQATPQSAPPDSQSQNLPPKADEMPASPAATEQPKPADAPSGDKESACEKKAAVSGQKCHGPSSGQANSRPKAKIVRRGSTTEPTIEFVPGLSPGQAAAQRQSTTQLLASTDANLKKIPNQHLSPSQQQAVNQIRKYMEQAKTADASGDLQRAHNLAFKARLLSDELLRK